jgi:hypothetical protein
MASIKTKLAGRAAKKAVRHTAHGTASRLRRDPLRSSTLLAIGGLVGFVMGRLIGQITQPRLAE